MKESEVTSLAKCRITRVMDFLGLDAGFVTGPLPMELQKQITEAQAPLIRAIEIELAARGQYDDAAKKHIGSYGLNPRGGKK